jgi:hypothetical protein
MWSRADLMEQRPKEMKLLTAHSTIASYLRFHLISWVGFPPWSLQLNVYMSQILTSAMWKNIELLALNIKAKARRAVGFGLELILQLMHPLPQFQS